MLFNSLNVQGSIHQSPLQDHQSSTLVGAPYMCDSDDFGSDSCVPAVFLVVLEVGIRSGVEGEALMSSPF